VTQPRDPEPLLIDMLGAVDEIERFVAEGREAFLGDLRTRRAVERSFEILGGAAAQMPQALRDASPEVPWRIVIDHRNRLIHGYASIQPARLWQTIVSDLPSLKAGLMRVLTRIRALRPEE